MRRVILALVLMALSQASLGSQEGANPLSKFEVTWRGTDEFGTISAKGSIAPDGEFTTVTITAFGKDIVLPSSILNQLPPGVFNGISLSSEPGYPETGGKTIYLQFNMGFTSGFARAVVIAVSESGDAKIL